MKKGQIKNTAYLIVLMVIFTTITMALMAFALNDKIKATYKGISEEGDFMFIDDQGDSYFFEEIDSKLEIDLNDERYIGRKFKVGCIYYDACIQSFEGVETEETYEILKIFFIKIIIFNFPVV